MDTAQSRRGISEGSEIGVASTGCDLAAWDAHTDNGCGLKPGRGWPGFLRSDQLTARAEFLAPAHGRSGPLFRGYGTQDVQTLLPDGRLE